MATTAVLLPRDCFSPSRSKQENRFDGESSIRSRRDVYHQDLVASRYVSSAQKLGPVVITVDPSRSVGNSSRPNRPTMRKGNEGKKSKIRASKVVAKPQPEIPTYTILQRPKPNDPMDINILKLMGKVENDGNSEFSVKKVLSVSRSVNGDSIRPEILDKRSQKSASDSEVGARNEKEASDGKAADRSKQVKGGGHNSKSKLFWDVKTKPAMVKSSVVTEKTYKTGSVPIQEPAKNAKPVKEVPVNKDEGLNFCISSSNEDASTDHLLLRRSHTDPQSVQYLATEMTKFQYNEVKYGSKNGIINCESYNEKWAGPAYCSSPAPSSLPLPKFTMSNIKVSAHRHMVNHINSPLEPLVQVNKEPSGLGSTVRLLPDPVQVGSYDAVLATQSLRRLLNLDP